MKRKLRKLKNRNVGELLTDDKDTDYSLSKVNKIKWQKLQIYPIKEEGRTWTRSSKQKAQLFFKAQLLNIR